MKIALLTPPIASLNPIIRNLWFNSPPLGLGYIGAVLKKEGHEISIWDPPAQGLSFYETLDHIKDFGPEILGISVNTCSSDMAAKFLKKAKKAIPDLLTVAGGPHITADYEYITGQKIDFGIVGEGEITASELFSSLEKGESVKKIDGIIYKNSGKLVKNKPRSLIEDLDKLPFPQRDLFMGKYNPVPVDDKGCKKAAIITSRGCPSRCIFCDHNTFGNNYRSRSPENIVEEVLYLHYKLGFKDIAFVDSCFAISNEKLRKISSLLVSYGSPVSWSCSLRADCVDLKTLNMMKKAGCWRVRFGIESGDAKVLNFIRKDISLEKTKKAVRLADKAGLAPKAFLMVGHFIDDRKSLKNTEKIALELPLYDITIQINTPLKGTYQYKIKEKYGKTVIFDKSQYGFWKPVFIPNSLTARDIEYWISRIYRNFYFRPIVFFRHIKMINNLYSLISHIKGLILAIYIMIPHLRYDKQ